MLNLPTQKDLLKRSMGFFLPYQPHESIEQVHGSAEKADLV